MWRAAAPAVKKLLRTAGMHRALEFSKPDLGKRQAKRLPQRDRVDRDIDRAGTGSNGVGVLLHRRLVKCLDQAAASADRLLVVDGLDPAIAEGAGTIGVELTAMGQIDTAVVQLGDGALIAGVARWLKSQGDPKVVGVCASGAPAMARSLAKRRPISNAGTGTIAGALAITVPVPESLARIIELVDEIVMVDDDEIQAAMTLIADSLGVLVEPAGAAGVAAVSRHSEQLSGERIAVLLTGAAG
jgi:threonine dehydratase